MWRIGQITPRHLPSHTAVERKLGKIMHQMLYLLVFIIMISGYLISTADGRGIAVFEFFDVPALGVSIENQEDIAGLVHKWLAYLLIALVVLHAWAALKHHFIDKDDTLKRMMGKR